MEESVNINTHIKYIHLTRIVMVTILFAGLINISSHCRETLYSEMETLESKIYPPWDRPQLGYII